MFTIWGRRDAFNVQKVLWFLDELSIQYKQISVGETYGGLDTAEFGQLNPHRKIPVISDNGFIVWESHAILRYLAEKYGAPLFCSNDVEERSHINRWMDWLHTTLQPEFLNGIFWNYYRTPEKKRNQIAIDKSIALCAQHLLLLNEQLKDKRYICGDRITLADITVGTFLYRYFSPELNIDRPSVPYVEAWYQLLQERPAFCKNIMLPFTYMKENQHLKKPQNAV